MLSSVVKPDFDKLAERYQTTPRSVRRWHSLGVQVEDAAAVATYLCSIQHPAPSAMVAVKTILESELESLKKCYQLHKNS
jgi:hypothetical protein